MSQTLTNLLYHIVFSTKNRMNLITPDISVELYLGITPSLQDGWVVSELPVVKTTGFITSSLWDKEKVKIKRNFRY